MSETTVSSRSDLPPGVVEAAEWNGIGNEFTGVRFRKVWTRNGERLELFVPRTGKSILLDAMVLEALAGQRPDFFGHMIAVGLGSADE
ncbi:hypothetical protein [Nocardia brevicatena]|uniref:hypothetical protein n=1 Tax=Nocardia brevicatena TaxID=37327 RepID=UPI0002FF324C|nr:hypothetical protein [Nocardia brevicatena]